MRGSKGFTLVELLAVLVILAIIALITTPIILGVIDGARKDGAEDKAWGYINAIEIAYTQDQTNDVAYVNGTTVNVPSNGKAQVGTIDVRASGENPSGGSFVIDNGVITVKNLVFDGYVCTSNSDATKMCCSQGKSGTDVKCPNNGEA